MNETALRQITFDRRLDVLEMVKASGSGHIGGSMSCMDILVCLYYEIMDTKKIISNTPDRDRFILSKGHCAEVLYTVLADLDCIPRETLQLYASFDTILAGQNAVGIATGLASVGKTVFVAGPACFLTARSYEQVKIDVAYNNANVKIIGVSAGVSYGPLGGTHTSLHDFAGVRYHCAE